MPAVDGTCSTCQYHVSGACRRLPPIVIFDSSLGVFDATTVAPTVDSDYWCGEYETKRE